MKNGNYILVIAPDNSPGKKYRGRYCSEHVLVYWQHFGILPNNDEIIHHKDGNKRNNNINNLELMKRSEHAKMHQLSKGEAYIKMQCPFCGNEFIRSKSNSYFYKDNRSSMCCSRRCARLFSMIPQEEKKLRIEKSCITEFRVYHSV